MRSDTVLHSLRRILGEDKVAYGQEELKRYSRDALDVTRALPPNFKTTMPIVIARPSTEEDVVTLVKFANKKKIPIVPYGAGTGLMGGAAMIKRGIVIDMKNMNSVEVNTDDLTANVGAGVIVKELASRAREHNLMFTHDPWSANYSTVGGAIATDGMGYLACKYGSMREHVLGLRAITGNGTLLDIRPAKKSSTGLDLKDLFIGSEGTFGIITSATVKLHTIPAAQQILAFGFRNFENGYKCARRLFLEGIRPTSFDLFEAFDVDADVETKEWLQDAEGTRMYLLFDGLEEEVDVLSARTKDIVKEFGTELGSEVAEEYWNNRYELANRYISFIRNNSRNTDIKFDFIQVSIPASKVLEYDRKCREIASKYNIAVEGHGIWQALEFYSMNLFASSASANNRMYKAIDEMLRYAAAIGTIEYVHGVGVRLAHLMEGSNLNGRKIIREIKRILDPNNIMNPNKQSL